MSFEPVTLPISILIAETDQPVAGLLIQLQTAPQETLPGGPAQQVGEISWVNSQAGPITAIVSLGKPEKLSPEIFRQAGGSLAHGLLKSGAASADLNLEQVNTLQVPGAAAALLEGIFLGAFQFKRHKAPGEPEKPVTIYLRSAPSELAQVLDRVQKITSAVNLARDWSHEPANVINPVTLAERVTELAQQDGLKCKVLTEKELAELGAGAILSVGKGSATPSRMIILEYPGLNPKPDTKPVILVGKAITFDTGGYSLKNVENIQGMKYDKCGGMVVAAMLHLASQVQFKTPLVGIIAAAENVISDQSYRPDDIIKTLSGKTVEIISTDAEGRLILADALTYAQKNFQPAAIIDLATLTGGVVAALGRVRAGLMANQDDLAQQLFQAGEVTQERVWRLPLDEDFVAKIKGDDADLKNSGGREGHAIIGGTFLNQFVDSQVPWAHIDIAGVADTPKELPCCSKGATGFGVRLLAHYLENL